MTTTLVPLPHRLTPGTPRACYRAEITDGSVTREYIVCPTHHSKPIAEVYVLDPEPRYEGGSCTRSLGTVTSFIQPHVSATWSISQIERDDLMAIATELGVLEHPDAPIPKHPD